MKYLFLLFLLVQLPFQTIAQDSYSDEFKYKAVYQLTYQPDSTDINSVISEEMLLYLGDKVSRFSSFGTAVRDSLMANRDRSNKSMAAFIRLKSQIPKTEFTYYIYKGIPPGQFSYTRKFMADNFQYVGDLESIDWQILTDTKEVAGYQAQKATGSFGGRDYTAWFTSEISISDGPYKFNGLPGLILEVTDRKRHYSFVLTGFEALSEPIPFEFRAKDYLFTTKEKFLDIIEENERNPFAAMERQGMSFGFESGQREKLKREYKRELNKKNNPIELE